MSLLQTLENKGASWAFRKFAANALRHWHTSLGGLIAILTSLAGLLKYLLDASPTGQIDLNTITAYLGGISAGLGLLAAKDADKTSISYDPNGHPIPKALIITN